MGFDDRQNWRRHFVLATILCIAACSSKPDRSDLDKQKQTTENVSPATLGDVKPVDDRAPSEMTIVLSDGSAASDRGPAVKLADAKPLSASKIEQVLSRLSPLKAEASDKTDFAKRADSNPPPKTGEVVKTSFPPDSDRERPALVDVKDVALAIERQQPTGETPIAPHLSITFNKPMVTIASHADTIAENVPVTISPQPKGQWRWVGSKTLLFEPDGGRFPMATEYTVTVPAGTKSANGETLPKAETWKFGTPPPRVESSWPGGGTFDLDQPYFIRFDQAIDRAKVIEHVRMKSGMIFGGEAVRLATPEEINADDTIRQLVENTPDDRWVVVRASEELPYDSNITVVVEKGTPSAEGPRTTTSDHSSNFRTFGPFRVQRATCGWRDRCTPHDSFSFELSNQLDPEMFENGLVTVEPSFPTMSISASGNWISINGMKPGRTTYRVTLDESLTDQFGQKLTGKNSYSFDVGPAQPQLFSTSETMNVLDPSSPPEFTVHSINYDQLSVVAYRVEPRDWNDYLKWLQDYDYYGKKKVAPPGKKVFDEKIAVEGERDALIETKISLARALGGDLGNLVLHIRPTDTMRGSKMPEYPPHLRTWVQATKIGLDAFVDGEELVGWATTLLDGEPLGSTKLEILGRGQTGTTDDSGIAVIALPSTSGGDGAALVAKQGDDTAFLPESMWHQSSSNWTKSLGHDDLSWFVFDDRGMYKPGEKVSFKGWLRVVEHSKNGMVRLEPRIDQLRYRVIGPQGNDITSGKASVTKLGGFSGEFDLPGTPNLGDATIQFAIGSSSNWEHSHRFQIQEFRTPEFEVTASAGEGPWYAGESATATVEAKYYAGGGLPNADVTWNVTATQASFTPPNLGEYSFGSWTPWWASSGFGGAPTSSQTLQSKTEPTGTHDLEMSFSDITPPRPMSVRAQATVMDVNRQAWTSTATLLVHPSQHYVGIKSDRYFVEKGTPLELDIVVADVDGNVLKERPVKVRAARVKWAWKNGQYEEEEVDPQLCEFNTTDEVGSCSFETSVGGTYRIVATTVDDRGRRNFSEITRWVSGGERPIARNVELEEVSLIPDRDDYSPGQTAEILVQSPIVPAEGFMTLRRNGMVEQRRFTMSEPTTVLSIPIKNVYYPNVEVNVAVVGSQPRLDESGEPDESLPRRPAHGQGSITLKVPPAERRLAVDVNPEADRLSPGASTKLTVTVKDADGEPVPDAEVAVVVVDEAILALSSYQMGDPMDVFYPQRAPGTTDYRLRNYVRLVDPAALRAQSAPGGGAPAEMAAEGAGLMRKRSMKSKGAMPPPAPSAAAPRMMMEAAPEADYAFADEEVSGNLIRLEEQAIMGKVDPNAPIAVRSNFDPLATFATAEATNANGVATVSYSMPDNLTRYRVMAVAVKDGTHYGTGESNVTARLPLMVRPSPPRFLNFGDKFELPVVLQNQTDQPMQVEVATRATNVEFAKTRGWALTVPANDRVEVRFPAQTEMAGTARFQVGASAGSFADANEFDLPVWTPATSEAFATYGVVDEGAVVQPVAAPTEVWPQFGGLEVTTSSTALASLTDAFIYLYEYDYQCAEQISSRMVSVAALRDVLSAFEAEGMPSKEAVERSMSRDIEELQSRQNYDGGFGFWRRGQPSWPYVSIHAAHALSRAKQKGYDVPDGVLAQARNYLRNIESHIPGWWPEWIRLHTIAYALYVRNQMSDKDPAKARQVIRRGGKLENLSFQSVGWLLATMVGDADSKAQREEIRRFLNNRVTETAAGAHFAASHTDETDYVIMHSDRVADGVILEALIEDQPKSDLIPKIVNGLLAHRKKGHWGNTQENAFVLLALDKYFNTYEKTTPNFVARVWLGDRYAGEHAFRGRTTESHQIDVAMQHLVDADGKQKLYLQKDGKGRMYYRIGMNYAPKSLFLEPADHGFVVERAYEPVDDDDDVRRLADGTWEIRAGAKVKVSLTMLAPTRRYHVALVDPLPAGLETMNPALAVTGDVPQDAAANTGRGGGGWWWWSRPWFEHQNMRDERTEAFTTLLWGGVHTYTYYARATTPGQFVVPPAKAEEMYHPETFGRSASDRVNVVDR